MRRCSPLASEREGCRDEDAGRLVPWNDVGFPKCVDAKRQALRRKAYPSFLLRRACSHSRAKRLRIIATEQSTCAENQPVELIDEVKRFDRAFAWTYADTSQPMTGTGSATLSAVA
jgi:hypothetical protein